MAERPVHGAAAGRERLAGTVFGRRFAIEAPADLLAAVRPELPHGWRAGDGPAERTWHVEKTTHGLEALLGPSGRPTFGDAGSLARLLAQDVELWAAEHADGLLVVHAGVVAVGGHAILLPGTSRSGKSTLVAALVDAGATYYSDEFAVLDPAGWILPYRRPPRFRDDGPAAGSILPLTGAEPPAAQVAVVAQLRWSTGPARPWRRMSRAEASMCLLANTIAARSRTDEASAVFAAATLDALLLDGERGEADAAGAALLEHLAALPENRVSDAPNVVDVS